MKLYTRTTGIALGALLIAGSSLQGCIGGEKRDLTSTPDTGEDSSSSGGGGGSSSSAPAPRYLYVASGACFGGDQTGGALSTGSATIVRYNISTGGFDSVVLDYNTYSGGSDMPAGMVDYDEDELLVLVENTAGRRIDRVNKLTGAVVTHLSTAVLNTVVRDLSRMTDGSYLVSRSSAMERFNSNKVRVTAGTNPYINNPASTCATTTTNVLAAVQLPGGLLAYAHSQNANSTNNKIGIISATGYNAAADCKTALLAPATTSQPTALLAPSTAPGHLIVAYGSSVSVDNKIMALSVNTSTGAISGVSVAYSDYAYVTAPTKMVEDTSNGDIFVAVGRSTHNSIERLTYSPTTKILTRVNTFATNSINTRCIAGLAVGD